MTKRSDPVEVTVGYGKRPPVDLLAVAACEGEEPAVGALPAEVAKIVDQLGRAGGWEAREEQQREAAGPAGGPRVLTLSGLGPRAQVDSRSLERWFDQTIAQARRLGAAQLAVALPALPSMRDDAAGERWVRRAALASYRFDRYRTTSPPERLRRIRLVPPPGCEASFRDGLAGGRTIAAGVVVARDLANTPPNEATPEWMAERAREIAEDLGMRARILAPKELERRGMGGLLAVGAGSAHPPRLVRLEWGEGERSVALVGKGVTFDTGGISIKPASDMDEMKYDKSGACTVLGTMHAAASLGLPLRLRGELPFAENMPSGSSYRPGDIVRCYNGKTVEIINTDAEGRMILADALALAAEEKPDRLLELSTLTGACVVALGHTGAGLFTPDDEVAGELLAAAEAAGERLWRLPLWPEFVEEMKGTHADLRNAGGRWGGASNAAAFLSSFVDGVRQWAHVDIAGPAYVGNRQAGEKGARGYGVATAVHWLRSLAGKSA